MFLKEFFATFSKGLTDQKIAFKGRPSWLIWIFSKYPLGQASVMAY